MAADMAAKASGIQALSPEFMTSEILVTIVLVMAIGIIWGGIFCIVGLKRYQKKLKASTSNDNKWGQVLFNSIFIGLVCAFVGSSFADIRGGCFTSIIVIIVSAMSMGICDYFIKNKNQKWLESFSLSISMIVGMSMAIIIG
jgi:L-cystine uptake protein TcyP (sodium:dicarboxylate symporter family)